MNYYKKKCRISDLTELWKTVFHDTDRTVCSFFEYVFQSVDCYYIEKDGIVVSCVYLIPVSFHGMKGRYCYAAATLPDYRNKGYMTRLFHEAYAECKNNGIDFLYLYPAEDSLYPYYERLGFIKSVYAVCSPCMGTCKKRDENFLRQSNRIHVYAPQFPSSVYTYAACIDTEFSDENTAVYNRKCIYPVSSEYGGRIVPHGLLCPITDSVLYDFFYILLTLN